jgi:hypothetical protein
MSKKQLMVVIGEEETAFNKEFYVVPLLVVVSNYVSQVDA